MTIAKLIEILTPYATNSDACVEIGAWDSDDQVSQPTEIDHLHIIIDADGSVTSVVLEP